MRNQTAEKQKITKIRAYATIDREEVFLNEMCAAGWKPVRIILGMWFRFEKCEPGEYIARVTTCIDPKGRKASRQRREQLTEFLTESGAEIIPETNIDADTRLYAVRRAEMGDFEINTDIDSLLTEYKGRRRYHITFAVLLLAFFVLCILWGGSIVHNYRLYPDEQIHSLSACLEFVCAAVELLCSIVLLVPIPQYTKKIKELRSRREFEE